MKLKDSHRDLTMPRSVRSLLLLSVMLGLGSCGVTSLDRTEEAKDALNQDLPTLAAQYTYAADNKARSVDEKIETTWLQTLNAPRLTQLVLEAQQNNRDLQQLASQVQISRALLKRSDSFLLPSVSAAAGADIGGRVDGSSDTALSLGLEASWELDLWGRLRSATVADAQNVAANEADYLFAQYSLAASVAKAYFAAIEANELYTIARSTLETLQETHRIVSVQVENGIGDQGDLSLVSTDLANAQNSLYLSEAAQRSTRRPLQILLGRYPDAELSLDTLLPPVPPLPEVSLPSELLERRPDLIAAERRIAASFNRIDVAKAAKLPSLSLNGSIGGASDSLSEILDPSNLVWQAAANLLAPLFLGGRLDAQVDLRTAQQEAAVASYAQAALNAFSEVESALDISAVIEKRLVALNLALQESKRALSIAEVQYEEGEIGLLDVLIIQQRVFAAQRNLAAVQREGLVNYIDLNLALGGSYTEPVAP